MVVDAVQLKLGLSGLEHHGDRGNRGVVMLPNVREDVGAVGVHFGDRFFQFVPAQQVEGESPDGYGAEAVLEGMPSRGTS